MSTVKENLKLNRPIGVMDSGVGGLTVLKELLKICPNEHYIFFGDTKNLPYGEKSEKELINIVKEIYDYFVEKDVKAIVMACNTSSAIAYDILKNDYNIEIYPLIQSVAKKVATDNNISKIAIMATQATVNSKKYTQELKKTNKNLLVKEIACPKFVPLVEKEIGSKNKEEIIKDYLSEAMSFEPEKIILGCTHYPYLLDELSKFAKKELFIDPSKMFAELIKQDLAEKNLLSNKNEGQVEYCASSNPIEFKNKAELFMQIDKVPQLIEL